jgi:hypothetical protein
LVYQTFGKLKRGAYLLRKNSAVCLSTSFTRNSKFGNFETILNLYFIYYLLFVLGFHKTTECQPGKRVVEKCDFRMTLRNRKDWHVLCLIKKESKNS